MIKNIFSIGLLVLGLALGQIIKLLVEKNLISKSVPVDKYIKLMQRMAFLGVGPVITLGAFWNVKLNDLKLLYLPILGICAITIGGIAGYLASRLLKHEKEQRGSLFVSCSFTNMGSYGSLICFAFFGELSFAYVSLYRLFEEFFYFLIGYPIAKLHGSGSTEQKGRSRLAAVLLDPYILVYFSCIVIGSALNLSGLKRPAFYQTLNEILIPVSSVLLVTSVGFSMRVRAIKGYLRECFVVAAVKFLIIPVIITLSAFLLGVGTMEDGLILKVILVLSAMPPAFNSLIPPQLYGLDVDQSNSCWLFGTGSLLVVVPVLYVIQNLF